MENAKKKITVNVELAGIMSNFVKEKLEQEKLAAAQAKEAAKRSKENDWSGRIAKKIRNRTETELINVGIRSAKKFLSGFFK